MWSSVLALALLGALDPWRLAAILLIISRPRPLPNLFFYWVGSLMITLPYLLIPLLVLHHAPVFDSFTSTMATSSTVRHIQVAVGGFLLAVALLMALRFRSRRRVRQSTSTAPSGSAPETVTPPALSGLLRRAQEAAEEGGSPFRRLLGRVHHAWQSGSSWVGWALGFGYLLSIEWAVLVVALIVSSGAAIGVQITAAIAFVLVLLASVEIILICYLAMPAKTFAALRRLHDWALAHRQHLLVTFVAVVGISLLVNGAGASDLF